MTGRLPLRFFILTFSLSIPFWLAGSLTEWPLLPGLPVASLMGVCPPIAAIILISGTEKSAGVTKLLKRAFDGRRIQSKIWYAPIVLLMPAIALATYGLIRSAGSEVPAGQQPSAVAALIVFPVFFVEALAEELGWMGYAFDPMEERWGALRAGVLLGGVWAAWHIVPLMQARRSAGWIAWWCLYTVATRVLIVWIYKNTGRSVFAVALYHAMANMSTMLFPGTFDPRITGLIVAGAATLVAIIWEPRTLARFKKT
jgi:membrane protease YdiL (CAAX protease family)